MPEEEMTDDEVLEFVQKLTAWSERLSPKEQRFLGELLLRAIDPVSGEGYMALDYGPCVLQPLASCASVLTEEECVSELI